MSAPSMSMIYLEDMENIALGGAFLGTGGGGSLHWQVDGSPDNNCKRTSESDISRDFA